jgi:hypothetical protein
VTIARHNSIGAIIAACLALGCAPATSHAQTPHSIEAPVPDWLLGIWHRQWIERAGVRSNPLDAEYLQTPTVFGDVRFLNDRPQFAHASSFADLTDADLRLLARQQGMTGRTSVVGAVATWEHEVGFQPPDGTTDAGRLQLANHGIMYEHGLDDSYTEAWQAAHAGGYLVIRIERSARLDRLLIVAGNRFLFVRNRAKDLPVSDSLEALIASSRATRDQIIEYLDCEFSTGTVPQGHAPWLIQRSTLPWREGHRLELVDDILAADVTNGMTRHNSGLEQWSIPVNTLGPNEIRTLFEDSPRAKR